MRTRTPSPRRNRPPCGRSSARARPPRTSTRTTPHPAHTRSPATSASRRAAGGPSRSWRSRPARPRTARIPGPAPTGSPTSSRRRSRAPPRSVTAPTRARLLPREPRDRGQELLELLLAVAALDALPDAVTHVIVEHAHADRLERRGGRVHLREDVDAVLIPSTIRWIPRT